MGGYNTLTEAAASGVSTVCVPRVQPRREQLIRARAFASRGLLTLVEPRELDPEVLEPEIDSALVDGRAQRASRVRSGSGGAARAAQYLLDLARGGEADG